MFQSKRELIRTCLMGLTFIFMSCAKVPVRTPETVGESLLRKGAQTPPQQPVEVKAVPLSKNVSRIAFVSNVSQHQDLTLWNEVQKKNPQAVVLAGNSVFSTRIEEKPLIDQYLKLENNPSFRLLRKSTPVYSIWNDLDYGIIQGNKTYERKNIAKEEYLSYWTYIKEIQSKKSKGLEHAIILGPPGRSIQLIFLDLRFYLPTISIDQDNKVKKVWDRNESILGEVQWKWLEKELMKPADFRVIITPLQIGANSWNGDRWGVFPRERQRLFDLLRITRNKKFLFISGGRGFGALAKVDLIRYPELYDLTVGPLNGDIENSEQDSHYVYPAVKAPNYGLLDWDWKSRTLSLQLLGRGNRSLLKHKVKF